MKNNQKRYTAVSNKQKLNKKLALNLLLSMVVLIGIYFGFIRAGFAAIQELYIWCSFALSIAFIITAYRLAVLRQNSDESVSKEKLNRLDALRKILLLIIIPMLFALLFDYMLIITGLAKIIGI